MAISRAAVLAGISLPTVMQGTNVRMLAQGKGPIGTHWFEGSAGKLMTGVMVVAP